MRKNLFILFSLLLAKALTCSLAGAQEKYSASGKYTVNQKKTLLETPDLANALKADFYKDCQDDVKKFCYPLRSADSTAPTCLETSFMLKSSQISETCFYALRSTLQWLNANAKNLPMQYSSEKTYTIVEKIGLMQWQGPFTLPAKSKPDYGTLCIAEEKSNCASEKHGSTDSGICLREKFFQGAKISNVCFPALKFYNRWIEHTASQNPECVQDYNKYCRHTTTGIEISDCMSANFKNLNIKCAESIKGLRKQVIIEKANKLKK